MVGDSLLVKYDLDHNPRVAILSEDYRSKFIKLLYKIDKEYTKYYQDEDRSLCSYLVHEIDLLNIDSQICRENCNHDCDILKNKFIERLING